MEELVCVPTNFIWSVEYKTENNKKYILIKYNYHPEFEKLIKSIKFRRWDSSSKGWIFKKSLEDSVMRDIKYLFPEWNFRDLREQIESEEIE